MSIYWVISLVLSTLLCEWIHKIQKPEKMQKIPIGIPFFQRNGDTERLSNLPQIKENIAKSKSNRQL